MRISDWSSDVCSSDLQWPLRLARSRLLFSQGCRQMTRAGALFDLIAATLILLGSYALAGIALTCNNISILQNDRARPRAALKPARLLLRESDLVAAGHIPMGELDSGLRAIGRAH